VLDTQIIQIGMAKPRQDPPLRSAHNGGSGALRAWSITDGADVVDGLAEREGLADRDPLGIVGRFFWVWVRVRRRRLRC
jgi:hypothetical protein